MSVVTTELPNRLDRETRFDRQVMDPELFGSHEDFLDSPNVVLFRAVNSQFAKRMILVVTAQIRKATTKRLDDAAIDFPRRLRVCNEDTEISQGCRSVQRRDELFDKQSFCIVRQIVKRDKVHGIEVIGLIIATTRDFSIHDVHDGLLCCTRPKIEKNCRREMPRPQRQLCANRALTDSPLW